MMASFWWEHFYFWNTLLLQLTSYKGHIFNFNNNWPPQKYKTTKIRIFFFLRKQCQFGIYFTWATHKTTWLLIARLYLFAPLLMIVTKSIVFSSLSTFPSRFVRKYPACCFHPRCYKQKRRLCKWLQYYLGLFAILSFVTLDQTLSIWIGTQFSQPNPKLGPLQAKFWT